MSLRPCVLSSLLPLTPWGVPKRRRARLSLRYLICFIHFSLSFLKSITQNARYATLVALMLSSQTKDEVMMAAIKNLRAAFGGSISLKAMIEADEKVIEKAISKVGFWKKKTEFVTSLT